MLDPTPPKPEEVRTGGSANNLRIIAEKPLYEKNIVIKNIKRDDDELFNILKIFLQCKN